MTEQAETPTQAAETATTRRMPGGAAALRVLSDGVTVAASSVRSDLLD